MPSTPPVRRSRKASFPAVALHSCAPRARSEQAHRRQPRHHGPAIKIVSKALEAPLRQIVANAGVEGSIVIGKINENSSDHPRLRCPEPRASSTCLEAGIVDPAKVVRTALQDAASVASLLVNNRSDDRRNSRRRNRLLRWAAAAAWAAWAAWISDPEHAPARAGFEKKKAPERSGAFFVCAVSAARRRTAPRTLDESQRAITSLTVLNQLLERERACQEVEFLTLGAGSCGKASSA